MRVTSLFSSRATAIQRSAARLPNRAVFAARAISGAVSVLFSTGAALACLVCVEQPEKTLTERVWEANAVVLARAPADGTALYQIVDTLAGEMKSPPRFAVTRVELQLMLADPERVALFLHEPRGWSLAGHGSTQFSELIHAILKNEQHWSDAPNDRVAAYAALHAHPDEAVRRTALSELSRIPYSELRDLEIALDVAWLEASLADTDWFGWWPLLTQMLGLHSDPRAREMVRNSAMDQPPARRAPWLIALIEVDGATGIDRILANTTDVAAMRAAVDALVATAHPDHPLSSELARALHHFASEDPALAGPAVTGLMGLSDLSYSSFASDLLARDQIADPSDAFALRYYIATARSEAHRRTVGSFSDATVQDVAGPRGISLGTLTSSERVLQRWRDPGAANRGAAPTPKTAEITREEDTTNSSETAAKQP